LARKLAAAASFTAIHFRQPYRESPLCIVQAVSQGAFRDTSEPASDDASAETARSGPSPYRRMSFADPLHTEEIVLIRAETIPAAS
jgi:hypothetical protein